MRRLAALLPIVLALGAIILASVAGARADARAEGPTGIEKCQTISNPGSYKLVSNLTATGDCLLINADFVTVDLAGFTISGSGDGTAIQFTGHDPASSEARHRGPERNDLKLCHRDTVHQDWRN